MDPPVGLARFVKEKKKKLVPPLKLAVLVQATPVCHEGRFQFMHGRVFLLGFIGFSEIMKKKLNRVSEITGFNLFFYVVRL